MHNGGVYLFPMHLSVAVPRASKIAQGIIHPIWGHYYPCAALALKCGTISDRRLTHPRSKRDFSPASSRSLVVLGLSTVFDRQYYTIISTRPPIVRRRRPRQHRRSRTRTGLQALRADHAAPLLVYAPQGDSAPLRREQNELAKARS